MKSNNSNNHVNEPNDDWGGPWTEKKLEAFSKYVWSYLTIMKKYSYWETIYFDGFAGSGTKKAKKNSSLFDQLDISKEDQDVYKGAAERVLTLKDDLSFDYYYFIDANEKSVSNLESKLRSMSEAEGKKLEFRSGDANEQLNELSNALHSKKKYAALIFLDPFGMQIDWESISKLKGTRSDIWILIPTGVIVNRLLDKKGELTNIKKLESFFGLTESEIRAIFYQKEIKMTLFGEEEETITKVLKPIEQIAKVYVKQLKTIWKYVSDPPLRLTNSRNVPIFHLVFASNNSNAKKIASEILKTS